MANIESSLISGQCHDADPPRLRILYLPSWYPHPEHPTYAIFIQVQAQALASQHELLVAPVPQVLSLLGSPRNWVDRRELRSSPAGISELYVRGPNYTPKCPNAYERSLWRLYRRCFHEATRFFGQQPDLIHAQVAIEAGYFASRLAQKYDRPLVLTEYISRPELLLRTPRDRKCFQDAMHAPESVMSISPMQRDLLYKAGVQREIDVVPPLIDTEFFSPGPPMPFRSPRLIVVGNLIPRKGMHHLLEAIARLGTSEGLHLELEVVGRGPCRQDLDNLAISLGIAGRVRFHGEKSQQEIRDLLRSCQIYVCSSLTESFGIAVIEAISVGLAVVVTRCGGPEFYVTPEQGAVVEPDSVEELVRGVRDVVSRLGNIDPQKQHQYIVDHFSKEVVVREVSKRYRLAFERHAKLRGHT